ncbi:hypothetical protein AVEN_205320-1 [Araneus ventricosus]|uniref:Uncharacterized protein n=1 Tax=Araneus ventricosus TaxID=182803 RepID=A0A4Y2MUK7_ARAVE|nr:hypothetical protein AVEN_205320-1 [Araneus ventricosus]
MGTRWIKPEHTTKHHLDQNKSSDPNPPLNPTSDNSTSSVLNGHKWIKQYEHQPNHLTMNKSSDPNATLNPALPSDN